MSHIVAAIAEAHATHPPSNFAASSSSELPTAIGGTDLSGMPLVHDESDLPEPGAFWSPEAMLVLLTAVVKEDLQLQRPKPKGTCTEKGCKWCVMSWLHVAVATLLQKWLPLR